MYALWDIATGNKQRNRTNDKTLRTSTTPIKRKRISLKIKREKKTQRKQVMGTRGKSQAIVERVSRTLQGETENALRFAPKCELSTFKRCRQDSRQVHCINY